MLTGRMVGVSLSAEGRHEAERLAEALAEIPLAAVVSSPQPRTQQTAAVIAARQGLPVTVSPAWDEIDFGDWAGQAFAALDPRPDWQDWNRMRHLGACPGGETMLAAQARAVADAQRLHLQFADASIAVISHADVLKAVLAHYLGLPLDHLARFTLDPAGRSVLRLDAGGGTVEALNLPP